MGVCATPMSSDKGDGPKKGEQDSSIHDDSNSVRPSVRVPCLAAGCKDEIDNNSAGKEKKNLVSDGEEGISASRLAR